MCVLILILIVSESIILTIRNHHTGSSITIAFIAIIIIIAFIIGIPILQSSWLLGIWISWLPWISWLSGR